MNIREAQNFSDSIVDALFAEAKKRSITNYQIAKKCGISQAALSYIKHHKIRPTLCTLKLIADVIMVNLSEYVKFAEEQLLE